MKNYHVDRPPRSVAETAQRERISQWQRPGSCRPVVVAFMDIASRHHLGSLAGVDVVFADSAFGALSAVRKNSASVLLISPDLIHEELLSHLHRLVVKSLGVTIAAVIPEKSLHVTHGLLVLGGCGVRHVIDLRQREGWPELRRLVQDAGNELPRHVLVAIASRLSEATPGMVTFVELLIRAAPRITTIKAFGGLHGFQASTLGSRFFRAQLPAPKSYLAFARLIYAASYFEQREASIADVALRLCYSSPQAFGRHVHMTLGLTAGEFKREVSLSRMIEHFIERLIEPYLATFKRLDPLDGMLSILSRPARYDDGCQSGHRHT